MTRGKCQQKNMMKPEQNAMPYKQQQPLTTERMKQQQNRNKTINTQGKCKETNKNTIT